MAAKFKNYCIGLLWPNTIHTKARPHGAVVPEFAVEVHSEGRPPGVSLDIYYRTSKMSLETPHLHVSLPGLSVPGCVVREECKIIVVAREGCSSPAAAVNFEDDDRDTAL